MSNTQKRSALLAAAANATSLQAQMAAVAALADHDAHQVEAHKTARSVDWADTTIRQTLSPVAVHERSTIATDWIADFEPRTAGLTQHTAMAEAAMWFQRTSAEVKADREEFATQAEGFMRREASKYGEDMANVMSSGLAYIAMLYRQAASGLDQVQQTVDAHDNPRETPMDPTAFDTFGDEVHPINQGVVGTETSERAPLLQEIQGAGGGQGQAEVEGGHSVTNEPTGPTSEFQGMDAATGPLGTTSVAISHTMSLDDFRRESASGLPQVQQVVDAEENPAPTPLPEEVAFPWLMDDAEPAAPKVATRAPFVREAGGDFYSGADDGHASWYDHPDYDKHYQQGYDSSGRYGEPITRHPKEQDGDWDGDDHDLSRGEYEHGLDNPQAGNGAHQAWTDGWSDRSSGNTTQRDLRDRWRSRHGSKQAAAQTDGDCPKCGSERYNKVGDKIICANCGHEAPQTWTKGATRKEADMFGGSDLPHAVPGASPANTPDTTPDLSAGYQQGVADGQAGNHPTFADASSAAPQNVQDYSRGYSDGAGTASGSPAKDFPVTMGGDNGQAEGGASLSMGAGLRSVAFTQPESRADADFAKAYAFATKWAPGKRLVSTGSAKFEAGLYAGLVDAHGIGSETHFAWREAHRRQARQDPAFGARLEVHDQYTSHLAANGIDVTAGTSTDLETLAPAASPAVGGETPINGPGTPPPLEGGVDPARPGGPAPYNGAAPTGAPAVPNGPPAPTPGSPYVNDAIGGPLDGNTKGLAFRRTVQASLLAKKKGDS